MRIVSTVSCTFDRIGALEDDIGGGVLLYALAPACKKCDGDDAPDGGSRGGDAYDAYAGADRDGDVDDTVADRYEGGACGSDPPDAYTSSISSQMYCLPGLPFIGESDARYTSLAALLLLLLLLVAAARDGLCT